ncbi:MAG TPA: tRNA glutamyl-Q(34) synthetase GluQRS [Fluviicoccus sp.]|nr:tRNA glutamyl-Q(34) synthetase GluQRS [Fluviicoccus sp.]
MTPYTGRFAPSPTGPLHFGSLLTAVAGWCDARAASGRWLVRIEDVDEIRTRPGAADDILRTLDTFGLHHDDAIRVQSRCKHRYQSALDQLHRQGDVFWCRCTRSDLARHGGEVYPGTCRACTSPQPDSAVRLRVPAPSLQHFSDRIFGKQQEDVAAVTGDFVIRRRDGFFAYQLAVVVDDADQGVTHVVRGADLLDNTCRQLYLQQRLGLPQPVYAHIPLIVNANGEKLSKQTGALALDSRRAGELLWLALDLLGQHPDVALMAESPENILAEAVRRWDIRRVASTLQLPPDARVPVDGAYETRLS